MDTNVTSYVDTLLRAYLVPFGWKLLGAAAVWLIGLAVINVVRNASRRLMAVRRFDATLAGYLDTSLGIVLKILLLIAVFGVLGVETTSFAALLAAAGIAIGAAWSGLLANFAAGLFLLFLRPFKVGDAVEAGGVTGTVREIGLFTTAVDSPDNVRVSIGNNKIFADSIRNYTTNPYRRVVVNAPIAYGVDAVAVMTQLSARASSIANVLTEPAPSVQILEFKPSGAVLAVHSYCHNDHYWQVHFDTNRVVSEVVGDAGYSIRPGEEALRTLRWADQAH
jgi:small conductance mechanosensitive channel